VSDSMILRKVMRVVDGIRSFTSSSYTWISYLPSFWAATKTYDRMMDVIKASKVELSPKEKD
jgi:hypothetical protein